MSVYLISVFACWLAVVAAPRTILRPFTTTVLLSCVLRTGSGFLSHSAAASAVAKRSFVTPTMSGLEGGASAAAAAASGGSTSSSRDIVVDPFCLRQFTQDTAYAGARITLSVEDFEAKVNELFASGKHGLVDGYAPFCKHIFIPNIAGVMRTTLEITPENEAHLRSAYEARTEKELPVLSRWFPKELIGGSDAAGEATFLDVILYSREQIRKENAAMGEDSGSDAPWGIVSVKPQDVDYELPMQPITMMRNALGAEYGGSGVPLVDAKSRESVDFWSRNAPIK